MMMYKNCNRIIQGHQNPKFHAGYCFLFSGENTRQRFFSQVKKKPQYTYGNGFADVAMFAATG